MNALLVLLISVFASAQNPPAATSPATAPATAPGAAAGGENLSPPPPPPPPPPPTEGEGEEAPSALAIDVDSFLEPYIYDPKGRRDPFKAYVEARPEDEVSGPLLPLQQYDVDQLRLVGIIWNVNDPKGMFIDPKGQVHVVRRDERIGRKNGYVAVIREGEVVVVEAVNVNGDLMYSTRVLKIQNKQEQGSK